MDEFDERLRRRLADTAAAAPARPSLADIESRARRQRVTAGALGGGASLAVVALAVAVAALLPLAPDAGVELDADAPEFAERPDGSGAPADEPADSDDGAAEDGTAADGQEPASPAAACGSLEDLAVVLATVDGDLEAVCADGGSAALGHEGEARDLAVAADGSAIAYEEARGGASALKMIDAASGDVTELGEGRMPALSPGGTLAWVEGEATSPTVMVGEPGEEPAAEHFMGTIVVKGLAWDPDGRTLYVVDNAPQGGGLSTLDATDPEELASPLPPPDADDGGRILAVAVSGDAVGIVRRIGTDDGIELATAERAGSASGLAGLSEVTDLAELGLEIADLSRAQDHADLWLADGLGLRSDDGNVTVRGSDQPSWLLGDGQTVWLVSADGSSAVLAEGVRRAAANPALAAD